ncbi:DUF1822 family protein [Phormidium yuhuli AB48]|uniref:DUF1822 family protein n=1 Tax=Phormidium yuhuli AB48 TaxID=2940671 RepID=A0ABY5AU24_9CYAN|nr:DUF1822 family protein [Phormidium yuhuli]USR91638.1 DUF1822 family protein [Phormidium yuhuli AB48]
MSYQYGPLTFNVPITAEMRARASQASQQHSNVDKSRQVYHNVLVVLAVEYYCQCMAIETQLKASSVWNPALQVLANTAELPLKALGAVQCCMVAGQDTTVRVPAEAQHDRLGYVAVGLDEEFQEAVLLGFCERLPGEGEQFALQHWDDLDGFLGRVEELEAESSPTPPALTQLSQWLRGRVAEGWDSLETLMSGQHLTPAWAVRGPAGATEIRDNSLIKRGKLLHFEGMSEAIILLISLESELAEETDIAVEVQSLDRQTELPLNLEISILDDEGHSVMQAVAKSSEHIKLRFSGEPDERFGVKVALGSVSFIEQFVI